MDRRRFLASVGAAGTAGLAGCPDGTGSSTEGGTDQRRQTPPPTATPEDIRPQFRVGTDGFERLTADGYDPFLVQGVNLGMAKPGSFPGQAAITRAEYDRWLAAIGDIANVVRTYTIHPPAFYRALSAYNEDATDPLLLLQGTWVPTRDLLDGGDASAVSETIDRELQRTVDVLHGETVLPDRPGYASGTYDADVSRATLGLLFGIEWPPEVVAETNEADNVGAANGQYLTAEGAHPFERWLATRLDRAVRHEADTYGTTRPAAFVNWVTTDPLEHPYEPFVNEDSVSVDPDAIVATDAFDAGTFAAYHAYPYYPDLLNETPTYVDYVDHRGEKNSYAGYLNDLAGATDHALLIAEFGVPSSRGIAHRHVHGRNQGRHTEQRQGEIVAAMYDDIRHAGTAGGVAFAWQNEWFKRTWNLDSRSVPGRRPFWSNIETPEQRFGLLAFDPANGVALDGSADGWADATTASATGEGAIGGRHLEQMDVTHDLEGLCVRLSFDSSGDPFDWAEMNALVTIGLTGRTATLPQGVAATAPADFAVHLAGPDRSRLLVESSYDTFAREFGASADLDTDAYRTGQAGFVPVREPINLGYTVPPTDERVPFEAVETGQLRFGNGNPDTDTYDSLTDVYAAPDGSVVELRLPWVLLNIADPSTKQRIQTDWTAGFDVTGFDSLAVGAATFAPDTDGTARPLTGATNLARTVRGVDNSTVQTVTYGWEPWNDPAVDERLKQSYRVLANSGWDGTI